MWVVPRAGWIKPESDRRVSDLVSVGLLTRVFPPEVVDEVIVRAVTPNDTIEQTLQLLVAAQPSMEGQGSPHLRPLSVTQFRSTIPLPV